MDDVLTREDINYLLSILDDHYVECDEDEKKYCGRVKANLEYLLLSW